MNKLPTDNNYSEPLLFKSAEVETKFSTPQAETKSSSSSEKSKRQDAGYTIIESLVAMIVVSVLMIAIAPVMAFSVATRVQARRTELAAMAGRAYIDGLRAGSIKFNDPNNKGFPAKSADLAKQQAPTSKDNLYCVDMDGKGCEISSTKDFYVQGAWLNKDNITSGDPTSKGYQLLVRVYRADSFAPGVKLKNPSDTPTKQSIVGSGLGDKTMPVVEMVAEIPALGDTPDKLEAYKSLCIRLQGDSTKCKY
ncbi:hormogonium polysaccharide secretion pseudopilin HpsB [Microcoleus sp. EPA2]|uniref:hormogonium polysaccharide secretion pseudopilin HpsB n=1 Tax=Microcoleus sp. EPA2 TaxID=2841654 RepID=UPI00312B3AD8